jgi:hypothetical protein
MPEPAIRVLPPARNVQGAITAAEKQGFTVANLTMVSGNSHKAFRIRDVLDDALLGSAPDGRPLIVLLVNVETIEFVA